MSSIGTAPPQLYPAPSPHGDLAINGVERLGGPAASDRILGDRAWPELAALLLYRFLPSMASFPVPICRWRFSRWRRRC